MVGQRASRAAVLLRWYAKAGDEPMALMKGTSRATRLKFACAGVGPVAGRDKATVRRPPSTVLLSTETLAVRSVPAPWLAKRRSVTDHASPSCELEALEELELSITIA